MFGLEVLFIGRAEQQVFQSGAVEDDNLFGRVVDDAALFQTSVERNTDRCTPKKA